MFDWSIAPINEGVRALKATAKALLDAIVDLDVVLVFDGAPRGWSRSGSTSRWHAPSLDTWFLREGPRPPGRPTRAAPPGCR